MSGGHWNYSGYRIQEALASIAEDPDVIERFPRLADALDKLADTLYRIEHALDWDLSSDESIENDAEYQSKALAALRAAIGDVE